LTRTTTLRYDDIDGVLLKEVIRPQGNSIKYDYEVAPTNLRKRGNIVAIHDEPSNSLGLGNRNLSGNPVMRTMSYDPKYNLPQGPQTDFAGRHFTVDSNPADDGRSIKQINYVDDQLVETFTHDLSTGQLLGHVSQEGTVLGWTYDHDTGLLATM